MIQELEADPRATGHGSLSAPDEKPILGRELRELSDSLFALGSDLAAQLDEPTARLVRRALLAMRSETCSIAVIGQIKAGKSSLINAIMRKPGFLPTHNQPWTAVTTRVNYVRALEDNGSAIFTFFDEQEWARVAEDGGPLYELAERFLPNFDATRLQVQLDALRQRVRQRHRERLTEYLGNQHYFRAIDPDTISRYVAATMGDDDGASASHNHYSDIVKTADINFDVGDLSHPVTLIDTPGTNDPFLVREELTVKAIEQVNACVVVTSATEPIAHSNVALMRLLRGMRHEHIIVFVNRIDELRDPHRELPQVRAELERVLSRELPGGPVPIVFGSARWANIALSDRPGAVTHDEFERLAEYVAHRSGTNGAARVERGILDSPHLRQHLLLEASGLADVEHGISWLMLRGRNSYYCHQAASTLAALSETLEETQRSELKILRKRRQSEIRDIKIAELEAKRLEEHCNRMRDFLQRLSALCDRATEDLDHARPALRARLEGNLRRKVYAFADAERAKLKALLMEGAISEASYKCDTTPLRHDIADQFIRDYRWARQDVINKTRLAAVRMRELLAKALPEVKIELDHATLDATFAYPPMAPLSHALAFDLEQSWWSQWLKRPQDPEATASRLEHLILQEYLPIARELVAAADLDLGEEIESAKWRIALSGKKTSLCIEQEIRKATPPRLEDWTVVSNIVAGQDGQIHTLDPERLADTIAHAEERLVHYATCAKGMKTLAERFAQLNR